MNANVKVLSLGVGRKTRQARDYLGITASNQQDILLRRRRKAIAVFERDTLSTVELNQRQAAKRFLEKLKRSETLLKHQESTKQILFARYAKISCESPTNVSEQSERPNSSINTPQDEATLKLPEDSKLERNFSGKLKQINDKISVPYVKLNSYTKAELKRPSTSLELKRKAWEKLNEHLDQTRSLRPCSADFIAKWERSVPKKVSESRAKLRELTKVRLLSQLVPAPPKIDVRKVREERNVCERIEKQLVEEFCHSLHNLKAVLPSKSCWMDVNEVYLKNAEVKRASVVEPATNDSVKTLRRSPAASMSHKNDKYVRVICLEEDAKDYANINRACSWFRDA